MSTYHEINSTTGQFLFVGGNNDGLLIRLPLNLGEYITPDETYLKTKLRGHSQTYPIFALKGLRGDEIMDRLLRRYARLS